MRATVRDFKHLVLVCTGAAAAAVGTAACADALQLSPAGTGGGTSTTTTTTSGGATCRSALDCAYPHPVCDPVGDVCVECISSGDCAGQPGTVCSKGTCGCPPGEAGALTSCADANGCVDTQTSPTDCGGCGHACFGNCVMGACEDPWVPLPTTGAPDARSHHVAAWAGSRMFVWGGMTAKGLTSTGGLYDPSTNTWTPTSLANAPSPREDATAVLDSTDNLVLVWGGTGDGGVLGDGAAYDPGTNEWTPISTNGTPPSARTQHTAVWAGGAAGMIVFGGFDGTGTPLNDGSSYASSMWSTLTGGTPPSPRGRHTAVWDPTATTPAMYVFGGADVQTGGVAADFYNDTFSYAPGTGWTQLTMNSPTASPSPRADHTVSFYPSMPGMIIFGGVGPLSSATPPPPPTIGDLSDGATFDMANNWTLLTGTPPDARSGHTSVGISTTMYVFGGDQGASAFLGTGASLDATAGAWVSPLPTAPSPRSHHTAVVGTVDKVSVMIIWGGDTDAGPTNTGAIYTPPP